uniref:Putative mediator of rna polymerase ii transcription subunit 26 n=1 Tax=Nyssomyia neivai TaxID=330878 RepID=A0A1L8DHI1_9DIPT
MISRKPGPPVPPRPSAAIVAHARLAKSQSGVVVNSLAGPPGRTLVYKSPSSGCITDRNTVIKHNGMQETFANGDTSNIVIVNGSASESTKENLKPIELEMYTKSPCAVRSKRITNDVATLQKIPNDMISDQVKKFLVDEEVVVVNGAMENRNRIEIKSVHEATEKTEIIINGSIEVRTRPEPEGNEAPAATEDPIPVGKKVAFHEMLIAELTAMRKDKIPPIATRKKRLSIDRSTDSSPNGTQSSRIRTSDWVEVGDNGKAVVLTSCHISLEDSGMEDEERPDDISSGVGDSWDSTRDNEERINMSLPGLPPLPKSLSGFDLTAAQQRLYQNECIGGGSTLNSNNPSSAEDSTTTATQLQDISPMDSSKVHIGYATGYFTERND